MKKLILAILILSVFTALPLYAKDFLTYYSNDFLMTSPGAMKYGFYGYHNPALLNYLDKPDILFAWSGDEEKWESMAFDRWGMAFAFPHLSFGFVRQREMGKSVSDLRLSFGGGSRRVSFGTSFGWSKGDTDYFDRENTFSSGILIRPNPYVSLGLTGTTVYNGSRREGVADLAIRPFGNEWIALFGDYALQDYQKLEDGNWSAGAAFEALPGVRLTGRYFDTEAVSFGLEISYGHGSVSSQAHFDEEQEYAYNSYAVRMGGYDRNIPRKFFVKEENYLELNLLGEVNYQNYKIFDDTPSLFSLISTIEAAKTEPSIAGIAINFSGARIDWEMAWELREKLLDFKSSGKKVVIYIDHVDLMRYHFASVADKIVLDPYGTIEMKGFAFGRTYYKGTLEKLGIGFEELRLYKYKSAVEAFVREEMSEGEREQLQALIDDWYEFYRKEISASRGISEDEFDRLVNEEVHFMPEDALEVGLVEEIGRWYEMKKKMEDEGSCFVSSEYLEFLELPKDNRWGGVPKIAVIYALGVCAMDYGIHSRELIKDFDRVIEDDQIKAVVLRVDSPGGDPLASDVIAKAIQRCKEKKPVIISQGLVAASGGYWISMDGTEIVASPLSITGSIGVISAWIYNDGMKESMGMSTDLVKRGEHADYNFMFRLPLIGLGLPDRNLTEEEKEKYLDRIDRLYQDFVQRVADARGMTHDAVHEVGQGRVWTGAAAKEINLVDTFGGLETAIEIAREKAGIPTDQRFDIVELPEKGLFPENLFKPKLLSAQQDEVIQHLEFMIKHNGKAMPILPLYQMEMLMNE